MQLLEIRRCSRAASLSLVFLLCAGASAVVAAQSIPRPDQLEPGVNTSPAPPDAPAAAAAPESPTSGESPASHESPASRESPKAGESPASRESPGAAETAAPATAARKSAAGAKSAAHDKPERLELETTDITGNRELPKVLYIVPWKRSDLGDLAGKPVNSLVDEVLQPLDRDVFQRENRYYDALKPDQAAGKAPAAQASESKP
jgi:hypothetical protein